VIIIKRDGQARGHPYIIHLPGGIQATFQRGTVQGRSVLFALVDDDHPGCAAARAKLEARTDNKFDVIDGAPDVVASVTPQGASVPVKNAGLHPAAQAALANGWSALDLVGTGRTPNPGPDGGPRNRSALSQAQMALCSPPDDWEAKSADFYPWEIAGWTPPGQGFKPPNAPPKHTPVVNPEDVSDAVLLDNEGNPVVPNADGANLEGAAVEDDPDAPRLDADDDDAGDDDGRVNGAGDAVPQALIEAGYAPEHIEALIALTAELADGALPSMSKLNYHLKNRKLPTIKKVQFAAFSATS